MKMKLIPQRILAFEGYKIIHSELKIDSKKYTEGDDKYELSLAVTPEFLSDNEFDVLLAFTASNKNKTMTISISVIAHFKSSDKLTQDFKDSDFMKVNVPAIVFPYVRAFVSTISANAGVHPVILPTINFSALKPYAKKISNK